MRTDDPVDVLRRLKQMKRKRELLTAAIEELIGAAGVAIRRGDLDVQAMAAQDKVQTVWLLRQAGIVPSLREGLRRVNGLLEKTKEPTKP